VFDTPKNKKQQISKVWSTEKIKIKIKKPSLLSRKSFPEKALQSDYLFVSPNSSSLQV
jgi:hypothetical protein